MLTRKRTTWTWKQARKWDCNASVFTSSNPYHTWKTIRVILLYVDCSSISDVDIIFQTKTTESRYVKKRWEIFQIGVPYTTNCIRKDFVESDLEVTSNEMKWFHRITARPELRLLVAPSLNVNFKRGKERKNKFVFFLSLEYFVHKKNYVIFKKMALVIPESFIRMNGYPWFGGI